MSSISAPCFRTLTSAPQVEKALEPTVDYIVSLGDAHDYRSAKVKHYELEGRGLTHLATWRGDRSILRCSAATLENQQV